MKLTKELLTKAKMAESAEELLVLAKENGMELAEEEAAKYFAGLHYEGELADEELDNVTGGCGDDDIPQPKYSKGQVVYANSDNQDYLIVDFLGYFDDGRGYVYEISQPKGFGKFPKQEKTETDLDTWYHT